MPTPDAPGNTGQRPPGHNQGTNRRTGPGRAAILEKGWLGVEAYDPEIDDWPWDEDSPAERFLRATVASNPRRTCCAWAGIAMSTLKSWLTRARTVLDNAGLDELMPREMVPWHLIPAEDHIYVDFYLAYLKAMARDETSLVLNIRKAARDDWKASAWLLQRRHGDEWQDPDKRVTVSGDADNPLVVEKRTKSLDAMLAEAATAQAEIVPSAPELEPAAESDVPDG